jgi:hypothetical protein
MKATLKFPVLDRINIRLIEKHDLKWLAELSETNLNIEVYEDQFVIE